MKSEKIEVLSTADQYLDNLILGIKEIVELFQSGKEMEAINKVTVVIDGIDYISKVVVLTKDVQKDEISLDDLNEQLQAIIEAFENEDYILIGDLFNYELLPIIENIQEEIKKSIG